MKVTNRSIVLFATKIFHYKDISINIENSVIDVFEQYQQTSSMDNEACGILMCSINEISGDTYIKHATTPKPKDIRKRMFFFMKDKKHQEELDQKYDESDGTVFLCGTWHTHPEDIPSASSLDIEEWGKFIRGNKGHIEHFYFVIVGNKDIALYIYKDEKFILLRN